MSCYKVCAFRQNDNFMFAWVSESIILRMWVGLGQVRYQLFGWIDHRIWVLWRIANRPLGSAKRYTYLNHFKGKVSSLQSAFCHIINLLCIIWNICKILNGPSPTLNRTRIEPLSSLLGKTFQSQSFSHH